MTTTDTPEPVAQPAPTVTWDVVALDTNEPRQLAEFYAALLGWQVTHAEEDWIEIHPAAGSGRTRAGAGLAFQLVIDYVPPTWPTQDVPQQLHLDFDVADLDEGERFAVSLGAQRVSGAGEKSFRVFVDPSGHPFCLCQGG
jgi:predicted enzyme related to lactoylglutathione lyase